MSPLDFRRATDLFMGTDKELALALGVSADEVQRLRNEPHRASPELLRRLGGVLRERARGMDRVGEMLQGA